ncbi:MAG: SIS domain-containing protein [Candidatus Limnocylindria bacterium]
MGLRDEIGEQPEVAARLLAEGASDLRPLLASIGGGERLDYVLIAARGTSDHAATYAQYALGAVARLPVALATPSLLTRYRVAPRLSRALVLGISQSGRSPDVVEVVAEGRRQGVVTAAITNDPASPLAAAAEHVVALRAGPEASVAATKTYGAELLAVAMLAAGLAGGGRHADALARVPDTLGRALEVEPDAAAAAAAHGSMQEAVVLGRGFNLPTALEWALKLKELAYVRAQGYSTADFQHGPAASLAPGGHLLAVSARGPLRAELGEVLDRLRAERAARTLLVTPGRRTRGGDQLRFPDRLPEWLSPLVAIVPIQLFCYHLAMAKGLDFEAPRGLRKVTLTR